MRAGVLTSLIKQDQVVINKNKAWLKSILRAPPSLSPSPSLPLSRARASNVDYAFEFLKYGLRVRVGTV